MVEGRRPKLRTDGRHPVPPSVLLRWKRRSSIGPGHSRRGCVTPPVLDHDVGWATAASRACAQSSVWPSTASGTRSPLRSRPIWSFRWTRVPRNDGSCTASCDRFRRTSARNEYPEKGRVITTFTAAVGRLRRVVPQVGPSAAALPDAQGRARDDRLSRTRSAALTKREANGSGDRLQATRSFLANKLCRAVST